MTTRIRTYSELVSIPSYVERYRYLKNFTAIGQETFGINRYLNQEFYRSSEWKDVRREVIIRDDGCDLGIKDRPISGRIYVHHINPFTIDDLINRVESLLDPEYLICASKTTHDAIHFGSEELLILEPTIRTPNDTTLWKKENRNEQKKF